jgi:hypothetical protein
MGVGGQRHAPTTLPPEKNRCPLYRRDCGPQSLFGGVQKISPPPPGIDPRTVQPVGNSHSTHIIVLIAAISHFNILQVWMMH